MPKFSLSSPRLIMIAMLVFVAACSSDALAAAGRVALVIGNGAYEKVPALANPPRDAESMAQALDRLGFSVIRANNSNLIDMRKAISDFGEMAESSNMAVVFYAGHGIEAGGENWLIPVDADIKANDDAQNVAISLRSVSQAAGKAKTLGLVILDACRDNPFQIEQSTPLVAAAEPKSATRSMSRGLAPADPVGNVLMAFAAKDGTVADDGEGQHSPFTSALLRHLETPGLEITFLFRVVRDEVMAATHDQQQPYVYGSLSSNSIYLKPPSPDQVLAAMPPIAPPARTANKLFTSADETLVVNAAEKIGLTVPIFQIDAIDPGVPKELRRYVGVWASRVGTGGKGRQSMLIVTTVDAQGVLAGLLAWGPPSAKSWSQTTLAGNSRFKTTIENGEFEFVVGVQSSRFKMLSDGRLLYETQLGQRTASNIFYPVWTLSSREPAVASEGTKNVSRTTRAASGRTR